MFKIFHQILLALTIIFISHFTIATPMASYDQKMYYDREEFSQDEEGKLLFKLRFFGMKTSAKSKNMPKATNPIPTTASKLFTSGFGGDTATTFFFTNNLAAELSLGFIFIRSHNKSLINIANNYNGKAPDKSKPTYLIPLTATFIYNIAPYGGIQPYVGVGGHATYAMTKIKNTKIKHGFGSVAQVGVDLVAKDYTFITFDVKQYFFSPKISYKTPLVGSNISSKLKLNPLVISAGVGFKF